MWERAQLRGFGSVCAAIRGCDCSRPGHVCFQPDHTSTQSPVGAAVNAAHPTASPGHGCRSVQPRTQLSATRAEDFRVKSVSNPQAVRTNQKGIQGSKVNPATDSSESFCTDFGATLYRSSPAPENLPGLLAASSKEEVRTETNKQAHVAATSTVDHVSKCCT